MDMEDVDNITKNIVQEIVRECAAVGTKVDENFCCYYVKLLTLDPNWQISPKLQLDRENIQRLVNYCIDKICVQHCPSVKTMKIQHHFLSKLTSKQDMVDAHREELTHSLQPLLEDILQFSLADSYKYQEQRLIRRIVLYITIAAGLGDPKQSLVLKEATYAFNSVYDQIDLIEFAAQKPEQKLTALSRVQDLVTGIRLFNRDCGKPCAEIEDLPKVLSQAIDVTKIELQNQLVYIMEKVNITTTVIECVFTIERTADNEIQMRKKLPDHITETGINYVLHYLILARQHEVYIRKLLTEVQEIEKNAKVLFNSLQQIYLEIHKLVKFKVAIPTTLVYPLFAELASIWTNIQSEAIVLSLYNHIYMNIHEIATKVKWTVDKTIVGSAQILTDAMRLENTMGLKIKQENNLCTVLSPSNIKDFDKIPLQYLGFCAWSLVETNGGLIPGNPNMGICQWKDKYYVFTCPEAAEAFGSDPDSYIMRAFDATRFRPELVNLLNLYDELQSVKQIEILYQKPVEVILTTNEGTQTKLHPIKTKIDKSYVWDIWDYYRDAIKLANITCCLTHSVQTHYTHFRNPVRLQTINPKEKACQTKTDNYTNVATPSNFVFGLRGRKDKNQHIIDLTTPVDEDKYRTCATAMENPPDIEFEYEPRKRKPKPAKKKKRAPPKPTTSKPCPQHLSEPSLDAVQTICTEIPPWDEDPCCSYADSKRS